MNDVNNSLYVFWYVPMNDSYVNVKFDGEEHRIKIHSFRQYIPIFLRDEFKDVVHSQKHYIQIPFEDGVLGKIDKISWLREDGISFIRDEPKGDENGDEQQFDRNQIFTFFMLLESQFIKDKIPIKLYDKITENYEILFDKPLWVISYDLPSHKEKKEREGRVVEIRNDYDRLLRRRLYAKLEDSGATRIVDSVYFYIEEKLAKWCYKAIWELVHGSNEAKKKWGSCFFRDHKGANDEYENRNKTGRKYEVNLHRGIVILFPHFKREFIELWGSSLVETYVKIIGKMQFMFTGKRLNVEIEIKKDSFISKLYGKLKTFESQDQSKSIYNAHNRVLKLELLFDSMSPMSKAFMELVGDTFGYAPKGWETIWVGFKRFGKKPTIGFWRDFAKDVLKKARGIIGRPKDAKKGIEPEENTLFYDYYDYLEEKQRFEKEKRKKERERIIEMGEEEEEQKIITLSDALQMLILRKSLLQIPKRINEILDDFEKEKLDINQFYNRFASNKELVEILGKLLKQPIVI